MTTLPSPKPGDLWLAYVYYADLPNVGKVRPVVILAQREKGLTVVAAKVTSQDVASRGVPVHTIENWAARGLRKPSYVRLDQRFILSPEQLLRGNPIGHLPDEEFDEILEGVRTILG